MKIVDLNLNTPSDLKKWKNLLRSVNIVNFGYSETHSIQQTIGIVEGNHLIACGSIAGNILKYLAVSQEFIGTGSLFNLVVSELVNRLAKKQIYHIFVFTKPKYVKSFQHLGFSPLAVTAVGAILERGVPDIKDYLSQIPQKRGNKVAAIVMNANPFTLGHQYLVQRAAQENDFVYVFVVSTNVSLFNTTERIKLVKEGTRQLKNVAVFSGDKYMVSYLTFPSYFLKENDDLIKYQTTLDAMIFKNWIASNLNISCRYLGSEPFSKTTSIYNMTLQHILPPEVKVVIVDRKKSVDNNFISASLVRKIISSGEITLLKNLVPLTTYKFIVTNLSELQIRIKKGMKICGN